MLTAQYRDSSAVSTEQLKTLLYRDASMLRKLPEVSQHTLTAELLKTARMKLLYSHQADSRLIQVLRTVLNVQELSAESQAT